MSKATSVLVVEDSAVWRKIIKKELESMGFKIVGEASNGQDGVKKYFSVKPDLVTMDIEMPVMDGLLAAQKILESDASAKIIMVSSKGDENTVRKALLIGALDFISKDAEKKVWNMKLSKYIHKPHKEGICRRIIQSIKKVKLLKFLSKINGK
jgi:two-component system chemotaxis response regulator CheY